MLDKMHKIYKLLCTIESYLQITLLKYYRIVQPIQFFIYEPVKFWYKAQTSYFVRVYSVKMFYLALNFYETSCPVNGKN